MNKSVLLCSPTFIKEYCNISDNLENKFLVPAIREAQDMELESVLGSKLLKKLKADIRENKLDGIYKDCVEYSQYYLAYVAIAKVIVIASVKIDNIGANITSDEQVQNLSLSDTFTLEDYYLKKAEYYKFRLQNWLLENKSQLPELGENKCHEIHSNLYSAQIGGLFLGGARGKGNKKKIKHYR